MPGSYDDDTIIEEIKIFVETLLEGDKETKIILLGHGLGGHICWKFAQKYPDKVEKLIAISAPHPTIWLKHVTSSWRNIVDNRWVYMCRLPVLAEHKLRKYTQSLFKDRFKDWSKSLDVNFYLDFDQVEVIKFKDGFFFIYCRNINLTFRKHTTMLFCLILTGLVQLIITEISIWLTRPLPMKMKRIWLETIPTVYQLRLCWWLAMMILISV